MTIGFWGLPRGAAVGVKVGMGVEVDKNGVGVTPAGSAEGLAAG
jgi:hypothetical protein